jgi:trans-aconitate methyltransferase
VSAAWYPDERDHAGPEHLEPGYVSAYDAKTQLDLDVALELLRDSGLGSETTLVDLGCGTGVLAVAAAAEARRVVGVDVSRAMLEVARRRSDRVEWIEAGFLTYEHDGEPPQLVYSRNALHHLSDFWKGAPRRSEGWTRAELETHVRDEHSTFTWLLEPLLTHAGFTTLERDVRGGIYATFVCRGR